jgi:hypothetical protein
LHGVSFGVEKPGTFMVDYDMQSQVAILVALPFPAPLYPLSHFSLPSVIGNVISLDY